MVVIFFLFVIYCICVCVCVCVFEREKERERVREKDNFKDRAKSKWDHGEAKKRFTLQQCSAGRWEVERVYNGLSGG